MAEIVGGDKYETLDAAVSAAADGATINLLANGEMTSVPNKTLTFTGNGTITIIESFGTIGSGKTYTFDGAGVNMRWIEPENCTTWLMLSLSGTLNVTNGATVTFEFDSLNDSAANPGPDTVGFANCAIYTSPGAQINVTNGSTFQILGHNTSTDVTGKAGQGIQNEAAGQATIRVTGGSTFLIDGTNRGYVASPTIYVEDSTFTVQNCTSNGSNGGKFTAINSIINMSDNAGLGLSTDDLTINNSTVNCDNNGYVGIVVAGQLQIINNSVVTADGNCRSYSASAAYAGMRITNDYNHLVDRTSQLYIRDNLNTGLYVRKGNLVVEDGAVFVVTGNVVNNTTVGGYGGGLCIGYLDNYDPTVVLPADAVVYNNHSPYGADDIYVAQGTAAGGGAKLTFSSVGSDWYLDGGEDCTHYIDGWYDDSASSRWEAHASVFADNHAELFDIARGATTTITGANGAVSLKAAHGLEYGNLRVTKYCDNYDEEDSFTVELKLTVGGTPFTYGDISAIYDYNFWGTISPAETGVYRFELEPNQTVELTDIPAWVDYEIVELDANRGGYNTSYVDAAGQEVEGSVKGTIEENGFQTVFVVNDSGHGGININRDYGTLSISKTIIGDADDTAKSFDFVVTLSLPAGVDHDGFVYSGPGYGGTMGTSATFTLSDGETVSIGGIPIGTTYTVTEIANGDDYTVTSMGESGVITAAGASASFVNDFTDSEDIEITLPVSFYQIETVEDGVNF